MTIELQLSRATLVTSTSRTVPTVSKNREHSARMVRVNAKRTEDASADQAPDSPNVCLKGSRSAPAHQLAR